MSRRTLPPEAVVQAALGSYMHEIVILGVTDDGEDYFASSTGDRAVIDGLLRRFRRRLSKIDRDSLTGSRVIGKRTIRSASG